VFIQQSLWPKQLCRCCGRFCKLRRMARSWRVS